jgi:hypothetical protein
MMLMAEAIFQTMKTVCLLGVEIFYDYFLTLLTFKALLNNQLQKMYNYNCMNSDQI